MLDVFVHGIHSNYLFEKICKLYSSPGDPPAYFRVIIDNMMNLELLFRTHLLTGIHKFYDIGINHAYKTQKNHFRSDYSTYHQVIYNSTTGNVIKKVTHQGYADSKFNIG